MKSALDGDDKGWLGDADGKHNRKAHLGMRKAGIDRSLVELFETGQLN